MSEEFLKEHSRVYSDLSTVESQQNDLVLEEFPEGPYGASIISENLGKSTPWRISQRTSHRFDYENHALHEGINRGYPGQDVFDSDIPDTVDKPRTDEAE
ncbi:hypothetical protein [Paenibacillus nasutitermitis]|uniref:Uncharacterized protein n=1 Tax=Paenibacillus nasutitermitis TaxID=1652958 RepID=A0A916YQB3_9BACL|nr:hypothetical protein [Paenibacillus nasutitermitis]GGD56146.1 hypothetical protein GCM10010911_12340 [Paenibacillus nasutitermitis]